MNKIERDELIDFANEVLRKMPKGQQWVVRTHPAQNEWCDINRATAAAASVALIEAAIQANAIEQTVSMGHRAGARVQLQVDGRRVAVPESELDRMHAANCTQRIAALHL